MALSTHAADWPSSGLDETSLAADPIEQFDRWFDEAVTFGMPEPTAMILATVSGDGEPRARTVLLKGHDAAGFRFYTNYTSGKGSDLAEVPRACLLFPWHAMYRQVHVTGPVNRLTPRESERYFHSRPRASQLAAWASHQSAVIGSRDELERRYAELERRWPDDTQVPAPEFWGGYLVTPVTVEFWHGRANRMHDRLRYRRDDEGWVVERLAP